VSKDPTTRLQEHSVKNTSPRHHQSERPGAQLSRAVGIRPQPDQVADEMAIRGLAHAFADAVNRRDVAAFESLWDDDGVWEIGASLHSIAEGSTSIAAQLVTLWDALEFFVQQVHSGIVTIDGDRASSRWSIQETGRRHDGEPYNNHGFYEDEIVGATAAGSSCVGTIATYGSISSPRSTATSSTSASSSLSISSCRD
jgi:ketosteroid isomerase-like protein